jgi:ribonuclease Z
MGMPREAGLMSDVPSYHISTAEIAKLAAEAGVGEVVLTHIIPPIGNDAAQEAAFMLGMSDVYSGPVRVARDAERIPVTKRSS